MKLQIVTLFALLAVADAGVSTSFPTVAVDLKGRQGGTTGPFEGLDPIVSWGASASALGCHFEAGATSSMKPTLDVLSLPKSVWGKVKTTAAGWDLSSKTTAALDGSNSVSFNVAANNNDWDTSLELASSDGAQKVQICKGFNAIGGRISVNPRYTIQSSDADVILGYDTDNTSITIEGSSSSQKLTVAQQITDGHRITPSVTSKGDVSVAWRKSLGGGDAVTTTVNKDGRLSLEWEDGPWTATIATAINDSAVDVKVNRKLTFL